MKTQMGGFCGILYYLCNLKNVKNTHGRVLLLEKLRTTLQAERNRYSGARKSALLKASSGECFAPFNFVLLVTLGRYTCSPYCVPRCVANEIDYGKVNVETNLGTAVFTRTASLTWRH